MFFVNVILLFLLQAIRMQEKKMANILEHIKAKLPEVHARTRETIDRRHFLALLNALTGFGQAVESKSPSQFIETIITYSTSQKGQNCLKSLYKIMQSVKKWLTFGEKYEALENPSDLDFDHIDVGSLPEIMTVRDQFMLNNSKKKSSKLVAPGTVTYSVDQLINQSVNWLVAYLAS